MDDFLSKPADLHKLREALERASESLQPVDSLNLESLNLAP